MKKVAILQSNYIPWKGYFDLIAAVDEFILFDDMQFTRRDWRNRNKIKTPDGLQWLTVPVASKGRYLQRIRDTKLDGSDWAFNHWRNLTQNYQKAAHFDDIAQWLEPLYVAEQPATISELNRSLLEAICSYLKIETRMTNSWDYEVGEGRTERLTSLCAQAGGTEYVSGPAARAYIDERLFTDSGIRLTWFDYRDYPEYPQLWGPFEHGVTVLDLLFNCGADSAEFMRYVQQ